VGDVDDRDAVVGEVLDDAEQVVHLVGRECRSRLVHDDQPGVVGQSACHGHQLLAGGRQQPDLAARRDLRVAEAAHQLAGLVAGRAALGEAEPRRLVAEEDVLRHREAVDEVKLLVHGRDTEPQGGDRRAERRRAAPPGDHALVRLVRAGENLDQRGLARAVLAEQAVHLPGADLQVHTVQRTHAGEGLDDAVHRQEHLVRFAHAGASSSVS
jgi:hypothetical protein